MKELNTVKTVRDSDKPEQERRFQQCSGKGTSPELVQAEVSLARAFESLGAGAEHPRRRGGKRAGIYIASVLDLAGYKMLGDGTIEVALPRRMTPQEFGKLANLECEARGLRPVFHEGQGNWWYENEKDGRYRTVPEITYRGRPPGIHGRAPDNWLPAGASMMAEVCERITTSHGNSLFRANNRGLYIRTSAPLSVLHFGPDGVGVYMYNRWVVFTPNTVAGFAQIG